ncbi:MAG: HNH endonuclease signature motif containing protein [Chloroflexota bacterium]|nr:HNH endonuclease signature motif containing protein [Chloroflexota bacterium]
MEKMTRERYAANPKSCLKCGEMIPFEKKLNNYCSQSCAASVRNLGVTRHFKHPKGSPCVHCGNPVSERHNKYCDECIKNRVYTKKDSLDAYTNDKARRQWLLKTREHKCQECGLANWLGQPIPLEMHHVDGDTDNNTDENLILICPNCHALTPTHKRKNVLKEGKRQLMRRKRYENGQTW